MLGGSLIVSLLLAESAARIAFGTPLPERLPISRIQANPYRGWEMVPGEAHNTYHHRVRINSHGLRGPEIPPRSDSEPGEVRVLALGDSLLYGQGVADADTIPACLEEALSERDPSGRRWRVINGGHRAYETRQEIGLLEELGGELDPDIVVVFWFWNDLKGRDVESTFRRLQASGPIVFDTGAAMDRWSEIRWHLRQLLRRSALVMSIHDLVQRSPSEQEDRVWLEEGMGRLDFQLTRFEELARESGSDLVLAVIPDANCLSGTHFTQEFAARAMEKAERRGWGVLNLLEPLRRLYGERGELPVIPYDGHYRAEANRAMALDVARFLLEEAPVSGD